MQKLVDKLNNKQAVIGIVGLGYVGLPLVLRFVEVGFKVIGFDIDIQKVDALNKGISYIHHISSDSIKNAVNQNSFLATTDFSKISETDAIIMCVPTPLNKYREPDLSYVISTIDSIAPYLRKNQLVSLESTTYPGTTEEALKPRIEKYGLKVGENIALVYSPEREDPANIKYSTQTIPKICGGCTPNCLKAGIALYSSVIDKVVSVSSTQTAEMTKLLENIYRAVNIGLVNELKMVADRMDIDIWEVINAAATKPFGYTPFYPGPGLGGHCIPIDPFYLTWKAREYGLNTRFIELAGEVNCSMPAYVLGKTMDALNNNGQALRGARVLILGIAYKKNVDDMRESPAVELMELLQRKGAILSYSDPFIPKFPKLREHYFDLTSVDLNPDTLQKIDCAIMTTDHDTFDYDMILRYSPLVIDTRGVYKNTAFNLIKA